MDHTVLKGGKKKQHHFCFLTYVRHTHLGGDANMQTLASTVLPYHMCLHAVLGGEESVAAGHWAAAFWSPHILQMLLRVNVQTAAS
jgi:hypothetical protein